MLLKIAIAAALFLLAGALLIVVYPSMKMDEVGAPGVKDEVAGKSGFQEVVRIEETDTGFDEVMPGVRMFRVSGHWNRSGPGDKSLWVRTVAADSDGDTYLLPGEVNALLEGAGADIKGTGGAREVAVTLAGVTGLNGLTGCKVVDDASEIPLPGRNMTGAENPGDYADDIRSPSVESGEGDLLVVKTDTWCEEGGVLFEHDTKVSPGKDKVVSMESRVLGTKIGDHTPLPEGVVYVAGDSFTHTFVQEEKAGTRKPPENLSRVEL